MEVSPEIVVEGLLDEIKRLTMEVIMLKAALKTVENKIGGVDYGHDPAPN